MEMDAERLVQLQILDITGKSMQQQTLLLGKTDRRVRLDVSQLPAGIYLLRVDNGRNLGVQKLAIVRD